MKRFWLFGGTGYYASGGFNDFVDSFDTSEAAVAMAHRLTAAFTDDTFEWWHVVDSLTGEFTGSSKYGAYASDDGIAQKYKKLNPD